MQQHPRRPKPVAQHREAIREERLLHLHEDLATLAKQRVEPFRLLRTVHPQRQIRAAHRLSPRNIRAHEDRRSDLDARVQDRLLPVGRNAGLIRLVFVRPHHRDLAAEVAFVEAKCGRARPGIIEVDVELHVAAPDRRLRVALVLHPIDGQGGGRIDITAPGQYATVGLRITRVPDMIRNMRVAYRTMAPLTATLGLAALAWVVTLRQMQGMDMGVATQLGSCALFVALWAAMMAAMMLPGLVPAVLRRA